MLARESKFELLRSRRRREYIHTCTRYVRASFREWEAIAFSTLRRANNGQLRSPHSGVGHNTARWRVYIAARGGRWNGTGTACNLVIDQFVTIWRFVCAGPVNAVYLGSRWSTSKRGLFGRRRKRALLTRSVSPSLLFRFSSLLYVTNFLFSSTYTAYRRKKYQICEMETERR